MDDDYKNFINEQIEDIKSRIDDSFNLRTWEEENAEDSSDWTIDNETTIEEIFLDK